MPISYWVQGAQYPVGGVGGVRNAVKNPSNNYASHMVVGAGIQQVFLGAPPKWVSVVTDAELQIYGYINELGGSIYDGVLNSTGFTFFGNPGATYWFYVQF